MRHVISFGFTVFSALAIAGGCGSDDEGGSPTSTPDAGGTGATAAAGGTGGNGGVDATGGTSTGGNSTGGLATGGTGGDVPDARSPEPTGSACTVAADCYAGIDTNLLSGAPACLDQVEDGYCTHECATDDDCCAAPGECRTDLRQVCSPFTSTGENYCFLSCEEDDIRAADGGVIDGGVIDANEYCQREAHPSFTCRSTGGGSANRKVCLPGGVGDGGPQPDGGGPPPRDGGPPPSGDSGTPEGGTILEAGSMDSSLDATLDSSTDASPD